jgi:CDP-Glycerol:Poly(glycerophosphate) glycerophosphotransferase
MTSQIKEAPVARFGFYVRNQFQVGHFKGLFRTFENSIWICDSHSIQSYIKANGFGEVLRPDGLRPGSLDTIFIQGGVEPFMRRVGCRVAMVQYGYAKSPYNFGVWRAAADVVFSYGSYAKLRFEHLTRSVSVGNPRWDDFLDPVFRQQARQKYAGTLANGLPMVVYAPTWGDLSSQPDWIDSVLDLSDNYNVFIKAHHNSGQARRGTGGLQRKSIDRIHFVPDDDLFELLVCADLLISDFSGAIFDAILCEKPVLLLDDVDLGVPSNRKLDKLSPEVVDRESLGKRVPHPRQLSQAVSEVLFEPSRLVGQASVLRQHLFDLRPGVCNRIAETCRLNKFAPIDGVMGQMSSYVHQGVRQMVLKMEMAKKLLRFSIVLNVFFLVILVGVFLMWLF